ncbi:hypothetical protein APUTEX25_002730 [Auxenochlorella protothecoides]|uniref:Cysteine proteinase inhibitor n=1 Tax=Auxenochlorella protothecoides TaxID=3075 RepID=A0A3M7L1M0_AUXPR|nr:hypothetical protein APUTEX25_002730 [Auxenochlorella protothecoides]|eukprot:RMZ56641.1 hypothetical protein APUTEX25_002730 [Auxenochlorella protothecoides]
MRGLLVTVFLGASLYLFVQPAMTGLLGELSCPPPRLDQLAPFGTRSPLAQMRVYPQNRNLGTLGLAAVPFPRSLFSSSTRLPSTPIGGFSSKPAGENDARVNQAVDVATKEVVAGTNYKLRLKASDGDSHTRYEAVVYEELPHAGGKFSLTDLKAIDSPEKDSASSGSGASGSKEAATFAVQQISSQSNSLMPFALKEIVKSEESKEGGITLHRLKLKLGHTSMDDQTYDVEGGGG